jgi:hypothetical protein
MIRPPSGARCGDDGAPIITPRRRRRCGAPRAQQRPNKCAGELIFVGEALIGEPVGITETEGSDWLVRYADVELGYIHPQRRRLSPRPLRGVNRPGDLMEIAAAITTTSKAPQPQHP